MEKSKGNGNIWPSGSHDESALSDNQYIRQVREEILKENNNYSTVTFYKAFGKLQKCN